jgi:hypothetical protein
MRRVTVLFDDEQIYRDVKAEAAKEGRPVKDVVAEALQDWLRRHGGVGEEELARRLRVLQEADKFRAQMRGRHMSETIEEALEAMRNEHP